MGFPINFRRSIVPRSSARAVAGIFLSAAAAVMAAEPVSVSKPVAPVQSQAQLAAAYKNEITPIFESYCYDCHGDGSKKGEFALDKYKSIDEMIADRDTWKRIRNHIDFRLMPPPDEDAPTDAERTKMLSWIDSAVFPVDPNNPDPGHVTLRRLNKTEYRNTIRDLLGVDVNVDEILPPDDSGYGFDNIGDVLTLSPVHLERYLEAAGVALDKAVDVGPPRPPSVTVQGREFRTADKNDGQFRTGKNFYFAASVEAMRDFKLKPGRYRVVVTAGGEAVSKEAGKLVLKVDGKEITTWDVGNPITQPKPFDAEITVTGTPQRVSLFFANDFYDPGNPEPKERDRNVMVNQVTMEGPLDGPPAPKPDTHLRIYGSTERPSGQTDEAYMSEVLLKFARRAFRRPALEGEIQRYLGFNVIAKRQGQPVEVAIRNAMEAMLVSPAFLFREEPGMGTAKSGRQLISEHALAARLSYFLWSSMPDDQLFRQASAGKLRENLGAEIARMIADPKSAEFVSNFAGQWLQLRNLSGVFPNADRFPSYYEDKLAGLMRKETEMLFEDVLKRNLPVDTLLTADYTFINEKLANHYAIPDVKGPEFRKVSLQGTGRRGIFGHGSFLTMTSYPNRTSPVLRGQYILENILDTPAPPPPPNVPQLTGAGGGHKGMSLRQQMEKHRDDPGCASCHALMDPIGFGMQNFDAVGRWRDAENDKPIDASGTLVTGQKFTGPDELMKIISTDSKPAYHHALAVKLLTYALGRGVDWYDRPAIEGIVMKAESQDARFLSMIQAVVTSVPFQFRRD